MSTRQNPINQLPFSQIKEYFQNKKARNKFTYRINKEGGFYLIGGELVPEKEMTDSYSLELRYQPINPDKTKF